MDKYTHVLAAVDFSESSRSVLEHALRESRLHSARLTLLHVIEFYPEDVPPGLVPAENEDPIRVYMERAESHLDRLAGDVGAPDAAHTVLACTGAAYHEIVRVAQDEAADLIVMGYAGRWIADTLGSTAMAVARHARCDLLLVREKAGTR